MGWLRRVNAVLKGCNRAGRLLGQVVTGGGGESRLVSGAGWLGGQVGYRGREAHQIHVQPIKEQRRQMGESAGVGRQVGG